MKTLIKAELYKYSRSTFMYVLSGAFVAGIAVIILLGKGTLNFDFLDLRGITRVELMNLTSMGFTLLLYFMMIFGVVITDEYKDGTLKNLLSFGISKTKIFFSRFITQIILAYILAIICIITFVLMLNFLEPGEGYSNVLVKDFIFRFFLSTIPYIGGIAIVNFLCVVFKKESIVCVIYYFVLMQISNVIFLIEKTVWEKISILNNIFLSSKIGSLMKPYSGQEEFISVIGIGLIYIVVFTTISLIVFKRQEV